MTDNKLASRVSFGMLVFTALLAISFRFDAGQVVFLASSSLNWFIGLGIALGALALLLSGKTFTNRQLMAIGVLYAVIPFSFYFNPSNGINFIILQNHLGIALGLWSIASVALSMVYFQYKNKLTN